MALTFKVSTPGGEPRTITLDQPRVVIGRGAGVDIRLPSRAVSETHAVLRVDGGEVSVTDASSTNGTRVNGLVIPRGRKKSLRDGDVLGVGEWTLALSIAPGLADPPERTASLARRLLLDSLHGVGAESAAPEVMIVSGKKPSLARVPIPAAPSTLVIGRGEDCGLRLDDRDASRHHAELLRDGEGALVRDLGSRNGIGVGGRAVLEKRLRHGDEFTVGRSTIRYVDPTEEILRAFEGGADEAAPPPPAPPPSVPPPSLPPPEPAPATASAPVVATSPPAAMEPPRRGADWVVVLLATVILAVSVAALVMVLRAGR